MTDLTLQEAVTLKRALEDYELQRALKVFFYAQALDAAEKCVVEMRKPEPKTLIAAQHGGRVDAYQTAFNELKFFADNQVNKPR